MPEEIKQTFEQAESVRPLTEASKDYSPEELAEIEKERAETEQKLFEKGAHYKINAETDEKKFVATQKQIQKIHKDAEKNFAKNLLDKPTEVPQIKKEGVKISNIQDVKTTKKSIKVINNEEPGEDELVISHSWKSSGFIPRSNKPKSTDDAAQLKTKEQKDGGYIVTRPEKDTLSEFLWEEAELLRKERVDLEKKISVFEVEIADMYKKRLNLHEQDVLANKEKEHQQLISQLGQKKQEEEVIEHKLIELELGMMSKEARMEIHDKIIQKITKEDKISKRKQRIEEERERIKKNLNIIDDEYATQIAHKGGQQGTHLTTGRHGTSITGNFNTEEAPEKFYDATADTHGGKVSYGKRPRKSAGGKTIRKS